MGTFGRRKISNLPLIAVFLFPVQLALGNGSSIRFWLDSWICRTSLPLIFLVSLIFWCLKMASFAVSSLFHLNGIPIFVETSLIQKFKRLRFFLISFSRFSPLPPVWLQNLDLIPFQLLSVSSFFRAIPSHPFAPSFPCKIISFPLSPSKFKVFFGNWLGAVLLP